MLTFLRNIRRSLIGSGSAQKYFFYAIGEISLVVIGILIALQINNWNESRKDSIRLTNHYIELKNELINDKNSLEQILKRVREIEKRTFEISKFINSHQPYFDTTKITAALLGTEAYAFFSISRATYTNLLSSGDMRLIKNIQLKKLLSIYQDNTNWDWTAHNGNLKNTIERYSAYVHNFLPPLLFRTAYIKGFKDELKNETFDTYSLNQRSQIEWKELKNDKDFSTIVSHLITYRVFQLYFYNQLIENINEIIALIDSELKQ